MTNYESMSYTELYELKEFYYERLLLEDSVNMEKIMGIINEISKEMKRRRNG